MDKCNNDRDPIECFVNRMSRGGIAQDKVFENCLCDSIGDSIKIQHCQVKWPGEGKG